MAIRSDEHRKSRERAHLANAGEFNRRYLTCQIWAIIYAHRGDRQKSQSPHRAHLAIFADRRNRSIKSPGVSRRLKGRTIRKVMGEGEGDFQLARFFFRPLLVQEFFLQVKPSARIFFSEKYCFVCHLLVKKNYFTKELLYFVGFNNNRRPFFNNYIKDLKSIVMYCLLFSDCFLFTIHFLTAIHIECFINVGVKCLLY